MRNRLKELRQLHQWSQADLARELGVSRQAVNGFESGRFDPSLDMAFKLSHLFDVAIQDIFIHTENQPMKTLLQRLTNFFDFKGLTEPATDIDGTKPATGTRDVESTIFALLCAQKYAGKSKIGAEHLLAGLLADNNSLAAQLLQASGAELPLNVTFEDLVEDLVEDSKLVPAPGLFEVLSIFLPASRERFFEKFSIPRFNTESEFVLEIAEQLVRLKEKSHDGVGSQHLLWGLIRLSETGNANATASFQQLGINLTTLNQQLMEVI
jgi:putative transcriptional regulator